MPVSKFCRFALNISRDILKSVKLYRYSYTPQTEITNTAIFKYKRISLSVSTYVVQGCHCF